jgi:hypothetical protein
LRHGAHGIIEQATVAGERSTTHGAHESRHIIAASRHREERAMKFTLAMLALLASLGLQGCDRRQTDGHSALPSDEGAASEAPAEAPADTNAATQPAPAATDTAPPPAEAAEPDPNN